MSQDSSIPYIPPETPAYLIQHPKKKVDDPSSIMKILNY